MIEFLIGILVGVVVGWNVAQPEWARTAQETVVSKLKLLFSEKRDG